MRDAYATGSLAGAALVALLVIGALSVASGSPRSHLRMWGLQPGVAPHNGALPRAEGTTQLVLFTRHEHAVDVDESPAGFSQGDEMTFRLACGTRLDSESGVWTLPAR